MAKKTAILTKRQDYILALLEKNGELGISEIISGLKPMFKAVSKITVNRDLKRLLESGYAAARGKARATVYELSGYYNLIRPVEVEKYFKIETDKRTGKQSFDLGVFNLLNNILTRAEAEYLNVLNNEYKKNIKKIPKNSRQQEFLRLIIELSWKSSQIEGNTYSLLETEALLKNQRRAKGHKPAEATMILNHKDTLDYILKNKNNFKTVSVAKLEDIHYLLTKNLGIARNLRKSAVGIVGTKYKPLDNQYQIREAVEKTCGLVNREANPFAKAILLSLLIAYIQPFADGNKRTSRLIANAVLLAYDICPLSYRNVDEVEYKKAVILFYEQNNLSYYKRLFIEQFEFAVKNYFRA
ncbi:MAG: Fic family protein [bacterium]|nr:Fic family protein [bacterium]